MATSISALPYLVLAQMPGQNLSETRATGNDTSSPASLTAC